MGHQLGIIGGGNMGAAIVRGGVNAGVIRAAETIIAEIDQSRREALAQLGCDVTANPKQAAEAEQIMLAVKPQSFAGVTEQIGKLSKSKVVISIMAGLGSASIRQKLGDKARIVRVMPNTPCQIGEGMAAIALGDGAQPGDESLAVSLFDALGRTIIVEEQHMYAVTAVSGSGPAYIFLLAEAMEKAAIHVGLDESTARALVSQTILGSARLLIESGSAASDLRKAVTSPGGTTAAALQVLEDKGFVESVVKAITAARDRGIELDQ